VRNRAVIEQREARVRNEQALKQRKSRVRYDKARCGAKASMHIFLRRPPRGRAHGAWFRLKLQA
jgi:hypothetical protein